MRIRVDHVTTYRYQRPARFIVQSLRLTPRSTEAQQVGDWRIETDIDARLRRSEDAFGNIVHTLYTEAPTEGLTIRVTGEVTTADTGGVLSRLNERLSPLVYLRDTPLTHADPALRAFADSIAAGPTLERLHRLMSAVREAVEFRVGVTDAGHTAAEAFAQKQGVCQDHTHIFIAAARRMGVPARYVSGHLMRTDGADEQEAGHAWAEAYVEHLGWVGFDVANGICPTDRYVRVACGPDYLAAAPIRGAKYGGGGESMGVALRVRGLQQSQSQSQSQS